MATEYFQPSLNIPVIGPVELDTIQRKEIKDGEEVKVRYSWVRGAKKKRATHRTFFIAVLPGKWSPYSRHKGIPMFEKTPMGGPFPGIESSDDIHGNRRWVLGLFQGNSSTPVFQDFQNATYIECPKELRLIKVAEFEAWQEIGATALSDDQINSIASRLWSNWLHEDYDARLWNSQNFVVYLGILILEQSLRQDNISSLCDLHWTLWLKQEYKLGYLIVRRHLTAMAGMAILGVATGGIGALASWTYALYGIVESPLASNKRVIRLQGLMHEFQALGNLLTPNENEEEG